MQLPAKQTRVPEACNFPPNKHWRFSIVELRTDGRMDRSDVITKPDFFASMGFPNSLSYGAPFAKTLRYQLHRTIDSSAARPVQASNQELQMAVVMLPPEVGGRSSSPAASLLRPVIWFLAKPRACGFRAGLFEGAGI